MMLFLCYSVALTYLRVVCIFAVWQKKVRNICVRYFGPWLCCGGSTRTNDLQVMSLASYQLLHSAMLICYQHWIDVLMLLLIKKKDLHQINIDVSPISELRVQRYYYFLDYPNFSTTFLSFWCDILVFCQLFL